MQNGYAMNELEKRKLKFLYHQSAIDERYSVIPDYSKSIHEWKFYPQTESLEPFPSLENRMAWFNKYAGPLSVDATRNCIAGKINSNEITHLITVSCTGLSAPGLDLQLVELMDLPKNIFRTSVNFMGCYAAIHAMKLADAICGSSSNAKVLIVCTELCTLHFQRDPTMDNIASGLLFGDGSAAALITPDDYSADGVRLEGFYSEVLPKGKKDMSWDLSSTGFLMTLSGYVPDLIEEDFNALSSRALSKAGLTGKDVAHWCIHPGGRKILEAIEKSLGLESKCLHHSYDILKRYGNMSSSTILFVLQKIMNEMDGKDQNGHVFGAAFGPGLTMETFIARAVSAA